jgi:hypothetical protein
MEGLCEKISESRLNDASSARELAKKLRDADSSSAKNRAMVDAMFNGEPPYDDNALKDSGQEDRTNLNFNEADSIRAQALAGYYDLVGSVNELISVQTKFGDEHKRLEWASIISEEFSRMVRDWVGFEFFYQRLTGQFVDHGVAFAYFPDDIDWRPAAAGLREFKIPRNTPANEEAIEVATCEAEFHLHQLYASIKDAEAAKGAGWDVKLARDLIKKAIASKDTTLNTKFQDWEAIEADIKNNDLYWSHVKATVVKLDHIWVRELDGTVTHAIVDREGESKDFLFRRVSRFPSVLNAFIGFTYGIGNGYYHGVRGLGFKILPHIQVANRLRCTVIDGAILSSVAMVQPVDQTARGLDDLSLTTFGPFAVLPPGLKLVERSIPNYSNSILPVINDLSMQLQNNTSGYQARAVTPDGQARTAYEVRAQLQKEAVLSASAINLFYAPWARLVREMFRRAKDPELSQTDPGGKEVFAFRQRLAARRVPLEALYNVFRVEPVRSIGYGSASMRMVALDEAMQLAYSMDEAGRNNLVRDRLAARFGYETVDRYVPRPDASMRPPIDQKIAELENQSIMQGSMLSVLPNENHFVHANAHLNMLTEVLQGVQQGQMPLPQGVVVFQSGIPHVAPHVEALATDPMHAQEAGRMRQALQQLTAAGQRMMDELQAQQENEAKAQQAEQQRQAEAQQAYVRDLEARAQITPEAQAKLAAIQHKMQLDQEKAASDIQIRGAKAAQEMALKDAKEAAELLKRAGSPAMGTVQGPSTIQGMKS